MAGMVPIRVNERELQAPEGVMLLHVLLNAGVEMPYFCFHRGLSPVGQCRICYVQLADPRTGQPSPKLAAACTTPVAAGMKVWTETPAVREGRDAVMEFLLADHPLDCPVCDKAGECLLQDYCFSHRREKSRMAEPKRRFAVRRLGERLLLWPTRCIVCTRCVRFCAEVSGTNELCVRERGSRSEIDVAEGFGIENLLSGNLVEVCPVGAILDADFLFRARVWFLQAVPTVCPACARGCNVFVETVPKDGVRRIRARENPSVNGHWMCDLGRRLVARPADTGSRPLDARIAGAAAEFAPAAAEAARRLARVAAGSPGAVAALASAGATIEEMHLLRKLLAALPGGEKPVGLLGAPEGTEYVYPRFRISADRNANRRGAELFFGREAAERTKGIVGGLRAGAVRGLLVLAGELGPEALPPDLAEAAGRAEALVVLASRTTPLSERAAGAGILLPGAAWVEKPGVVVNDSGRAQRLRRAVPPPPGAREEVGWLDAMLAALDPARGAAPSVREAAEVFADAAREVPALAGMTYGSLGEAGQPVGT